MAGEINFLALDTNIPAKIGESFNPAGAYGKGQQNALSMQGERQKQQMNALTLQEAAESRQAYAPYGGKAGFEIQGELAKQEQNKTKLSRENIEYHGKVLDAVSQELFAIKENPTPENVDQVFSSLEARGIDTSIMRQELDSTGGDLRKFVDIGIAKTKEGQALLNQAWTQQHRAETDADFYRRDPQGYARYKAAGRSAEGGEGGKVPSGYRRSADGNLEAIPGGPGDKKTQGRPLPTAALKLQQEELDAIGTASTIAADLGEIKRQVDTKELQLGPGKNLANSALNMAGMSTKGSQKFASFKATLEKLRNDSLRLNKGVQTEGDAVRAWNEILANINDQDLVSNRLDEVIKINDRAKNLRTMNVDTIRANYGHDPLDLSGYGNMPSALGKTKPGGAMPPQPGTMKDGYRFNGGNPADPASWVKVP